MEPKVDWRGVTAFIVISLSLAWLFVSPLWFSGQGLEHPLMLPLSVGMMWSPAIATVIVTRWVSPMDDIRGGTGLVFGVDCLRYWGFAWVVIPLFSLLAPIVAAFFGVFELDLVELSGFKALLVDLGAAEVLDQMPIHVLFAAQLLNLGIAPLLNAPATFGEEYGWRGYLLPALLPLGQWPALVIGGVIWGVWHAPLILLGYNYPTHPWLGVLLMCGLTVVYGIILGWTRLKTGSVWPAVFAHGALNGSAALIAVMGKAGTEYDSALAGVTGVTGWILPALFIAWLVLTKRLPVDSPACISTAGTSTEPTSTPTSTRSEA